MSLFVASRRRRRRRSSSSLAVENERRVTSPPSSHLPLSSSSSSPFFEILPDPRPRGARCHPRCVPGPPRRPHGQIRRVPPLQSLCAKVPEDSSFISRRHLHSGDGGRVEGDARDDDGDEGWFFLKSFFLVLASRGSERASERASKREGSVFRSFSFRSFFLLLTLRKKKK